MLDIEYQIMKMIQGKKDCRWIDVLNTFDPRSQCNITQSILECLLDAGLIHSSCPKDPVSGLLYLDKNAVHAMLLEDESRRKESDRERKQSKERRQDKIASVVTALVSAVVGSAIPLLFHALKQLLGIVP